ncbi:hypothetical protein DFH09DRAFT_1375255 [Mycena vulgaris]|nr:hypothetical protein DFH09DRAFT_1375255 [Mycena vulgaris]
MNTSTSTSNTTTGKPGIGSKIKGAVQVVHGLGENVRGTILGGVDTVVHGNSADNDAIAAKGREENAEGLARMKGGPVAAEYARPTGSAPHGHTGQNYGNGVAALAGEQSGVRPNPGTETDYTGGVVNGGGAGTQAQHDSRNLVPGAGPAGTHTAGADMDPRHAQNYGQGDSATGNTGALENAGAPGTQPSRAPGPGTGAHAQPLNAQPGYIEAEGQSYGQGVPGAPEQSDWQNRQAPHDSHAPVPGTGIRRNRRDEPGEPVARSQPPVPRSRSGRAKDSGIRRSGEHGDAAATRPARGGAAAPPRRRDIRGWCWGAAGARGSARVYVDSGGPSGRCGGAI